jgi:hypothetical protein
MPRARMIKPDFWDDERLTCGTTMQARLVYIALWNFSDDYGTVKGNPLWLKNHVFPYDEGLTVAAFKGWLQELEAGLWLVPFEAKGESYYYLPNFTKHQRIDKPSKTIRNPSPPAEVIAAAGRGGSSCVATLFEPSKSPRRALVEPSKSPRRRSESESEVKLKISESEATATPLSKDNKIATLRKQLRKSGKFPDVDSWAAKLLQEGKHPGAIAQALQRCLDSPKVNPANAWRYASKIVNVESGNFCERECAEQHKAQKGQGVPGQLQNLTKGILKDV